MNDLITQHLDVWTSAIASKASVGRGSSDKQTAYGIKKLRELILELAVRGKLVPQDSNDEPARVLLEKISKEKVRLAREGIIGKEKTSSVISAEERPYQIPKCWEWVRLIDLYYSISPSGKKIKTSEIIGDGEYPVVDQGQSYIAGYTSNSELLIQLPGPVIVFGDHTTEIKYIDFNFVAGADGTKILRPYLMDERYFYVYLKSYKLENRGYARHFKVLNANLMALPPLNEQHRIVAKVDELMALCDQLEQQQTVHLTAHQTLVQTLLGTLTQAADATEFEQAWSRIADHFDTLFTTESSIDQLKQTLLQLAVMGKLVPQDPNDEESSILLKKVANEKSELIKEGTLKTQKPLPPVSEDEMFFKLPVGWAWTRLDNLSLHSEAGWSPNCESTPREGENWGVLKVSAVTWGKFNPEENKALPKALEPKPEYEIMAGDFLISRANTADLVARAVIVPENPPRHLMMSDKIIRFVFSKKVSSAFINLVNSSEYSRSYYAKVAGGTSSSMKNVSREQIRMLVIALPPLPEQHRIVAKVDKLMALCDALKARIAAAQTTQLQLADAIVEQAVS